LLARPGVKVSRKEIAVIPVRLPPGGPIRSARDRAGEEPLSQLQTDIDRLNIALCERADPSPATTGRAGEKIEVALPEP